MSDQALWLACAEDFIRLLVSAFHLRLYLDRVLRKPPTCTGSPKMDHIYYNICNQHLHHLPPTPATQGQLYM
jgi:hypothetical protein